MFTNLTQTQIDNIQLGEGLVYLNYGEEDEKMLAPTRGGGEFTVTNTIRNIEHDGAMGAEAGLQVVEKQEAKLKVTTLDMSMENLALSIPGATYDSTSKTIENGVNGIIKSTDYIKNVTIITEKAGGKYQKLQIFNALHEGGLTYKAAPKAEGELALEFSGHFKPTDTTDNSKLWKISEVDTLIKAE